MRNSKLNYVKLKAEPQTLARKDKMVQYEKTPYILVYVSSRTQIGKITRTAVYLVQCSLVDVKWRNEQYCCIENTTLEPEYETVK